MNAIAFVSAYRQLQPSERQFVDGFVRSLEIENEKRELERLDVTLERFAARVDLNTLDARTRAYFERPLIAAAIRERVNELAASKDLTPERIIREHAAIAFANMEDYFEVGEDGFPNVDLDGLSRQQWAAVAEIDVVDETGRNGSKRRIKFKLHNKQNSLDTLAKWAGLDQSDNAAYIAYRAIADKVAEFPSSATVEQLQDEYARFIAED